MFKPSKYRYLKREHNTLRRVNRRLAILRTWSFSFDDPERLCRVYPRNRLRKFNLSHPGCPMCKRPRYKTRKGLSKRVQDVIRSWRF